MSIEGRERTEHTMSVESRAIWPKTIGKERKERGK